MTLFSFSLTVVLIFLQLSHCQFKTILVIVNVALFYVQYVYNIIKSGVSVLITHAQTKLLVFCRTLTL